MSELPEGWVRVSLGELCEINPKHPKDLDRSLQVSFIPMLAVSDDLGIIMDHDYRTLDEIWTGYTHFQEEDVIFAKITPCMENGKIAVARGLKSGLACGSTEFFIFCCSEGISNQLLWYFLRQETFREEAERHMAGAVGQRRVPRSYLEGFVYNLPPEKEQLRIVAKLDSLFARTKTARDELDRIPLLIEHYKQSVLSAAFIGDLTYQWRQDRGEPNYGFTNLGSLVTDLRYGTAQKCHPDIEGVPVLRIPNVIAGRIDLTDLKYGKLDKKTLDKLRLQDGDILVVRSNGSVELVGRAALVTSKEVGLAYAGYLIRIRPNTDFILPRFLALMLETPQIRRVIETGARSTAGVHNINSVELSALSIPRPSLDEQREIVCRIDARFSWLDKAAAEYGRALHLLPRLVEEVLAKAFRGQLVPQDPNDEPASILMERIRAERSEKQKSRKRILKGRSTEKKFTARIGERSMAKKRTEVSENHLSEILGTLGGAVDADELWQRSDMDVDEFYKLLRDEIAAGRIKESAEKERLVLADAA